MLPASNRMRKSDDFRIVRRRGKKIVLECAIIHIFQGFYGHEPPRVGITVGKDCGNSVARHRLSRRIRGAIAQHIEALPLGSGVVIRTIPAAVHERDLNQVLASGLQRVSS